MLQTQNSHQEIEYQKKQIRLISFALNFFLKEADDNSFVSKSHQVQNALNECSNFNKCPY